MSINEPEHPAFAEASTAELPPQAPPTPQPSKSPTSLVRIRMWASRLESIFVRRLLVVGVLGVMVMIGLFLSNYSSERARYYWCPMFPIFGLACLAHELAAGRAYEFALWRILLRQALHWIGPIVAVKILFMQHARGQMSTDAVALTIILLLAVTCFLAGVHFDRSFYWVSAFLVEHCSERIELGLFTRDEMTWAFEFSGMEVRYDSEGLMGRGLYVGKHESKICAGAGAASGSESRPRI